MLSLKKKVTCIIFIFNVWASPLKNVQFEINDSTTIS